MSLIDPKLAQAEVDLWKNTTSKECREALMIFFKRQIPFWQLYILTDMLYTHGIPLMEFTTAGCGCAIGMIAGSEKYFVNMHATINGTTLKFEGQVDSPLHAAEVLSAIYSEFKKKTAEIHSLAVTEV